MSRHRGLLAGIAAATLLASMVGVFVVRSRVQDAPGGDSAASAPAPSRGPVRAGSPSSSGGPSRPEPDEAARAASRGQDIVMCRALVRTWIQYLEQGNDLGAERTRAAVMAYGPVAKESIEWAISTMKLGDSTRVALRKSYEAL